MPLKPTDRFTYSRNGGGNRDERCAIRVNIPGVETDAERASTRYKIDVTNVQTRQTWQTTHRYSEFLALRNELLAHFAKAERKCPGCVNFEKVIRLFEFPTKRYFTSKNAVVINYRKTALRAFLELLTSHTFTTSPKCPTCSGLPFTAVRDFLTDEPASASQSSASPTSSLDGDLLDARESVRESVRDTIQVKNFTTYVAPPKSAPVSSDGVFVRQKSKQSSTRDKADMPPSAMKAQPKQAKQPSQKQSAQDLPAPPASSKAVASLPASPTRADAEQARRDEAASFVSFSGASEAMSSAPMASSPRRAATPKNSGKKKNKRGSSRPSLESEGSVKESQDDEFGSLNMDFLQSVSVAKE